MSTFILRPGTSQWKPQTMLSIDVEDAKAAGLVLLWKHELKMATKNIEKKKWVKNQALAWRTYARANQEKACPKLKLRGLISLTPNSK